MVLPEAEAEADEVESVVMAAALESMALLRGTQVFNPTATATEAAAADCKTFGALSLALLVCRSGLCDGQSYSARVEGRQGRGQTHTQGQRWIPAARVTQPGSPIASKASAMISEGLGNEWEGRSRRRGWQGWLGEALHERTTTTVAMPPGAEAKESQNSKSKVPTLPGSPEGA